MMSVPSRCSFTLSLCYLIQAQLAGGRKRRGRARERCVNIPNDHLQDLLPTFENAILSVRTRRFFITDTDTRLKPASAVIWTVGACVSGSKVSV